MIQIQLRLLPCGCCIEREMSSLRFCPEALECPWCACTFSMRDLNQWWRTAPPMYVERMRSLVRVRHKRILEIVDVCPEDNQMLVRSRAGSNPFLLDAPPQDVEFIFD